MDKTKLQYFNAASHRVAIYVPADVERDIFHSFALCEVDLAQTLAHKYRKEQSFTDAAAMFLSSLYGGATITPASGCWWSGPFVHRDNINIVYSFTDTVDLEPIIEFCIHLLRETKEEAIALEVAGSLHFIDAESAAAYIRDNDIQLFPRRVSMFDRGNPELSGVALSDYHNRPFGQQLLAESYIEGFILNIRQIVRETHGWISAETPESLLPYPRS